MLEPLLFGLIGSYIDFFTFDFSIVGKAIIVLLIGLVFRISGVLIALIGTDYDLYEKIFVGISWSPKCTVQAALASLILDAATQNDNQLYIAWGKQIITIIVTFILVVNPFVGLIINICGHKLLTHEDDENFTEEVKTVRRESMYKRNSLEIIDEIEVMPTIEKFKDLLGNKEN